MKLEKVSQLTGKVHTMDIPELSESEYLHWWNDPHRKHVQQEFSHLSEGVREFMITGITPKEWDECFGNIEED